MRNSTFANTALMVASNVEFNIRRNAYPDFYFSLPECADKKCGIVGKVGNSRGERFVFMVVG